MNNMTSKQFREQEGLLFQLDDRESNLLLHQVTGWLRSGAPDTKRGESKLRGLIISGAQRTINERKESQGG
jgi:hypothetical protein